MSDRRILVTGGAGFVGSSLCLHLAEAEPHWDIVAADNLYRRGSELNLPRLKAAGVRFVHADVRHEQDLASLGSFDALVECSAEPSVMAGVGGSPDFVFQTNLVGAYACLKAAAANDAQVIFLSTSRVYPIAPIEALAYAEAETRFELLDEQALPGASSAGIAEDFPLAGARTMYGATKLSGELLVEEFAASYGLRTTIDRCGVIAGPWQMGKVDQGVFTHWALAHVLGKPLSYIGYGGQGKQVRDLLHIGDLVGLIAEQLRDPDHWAGTTFNVGGGRECSLSLRETTALCRELTGNEMDVPPADADRPGDMRIYLSDCARLHAHTGWRPAKDARAILTDIVEWIRANRELVAGALG